MNTDLHTTPPTFWRTRQAVILDWYDGPREGICVLEHPRAEFYCELLDERDNPDGLDERLFRLHLLPEGAVERLLATLKEAGLGEPMHRTWVPRWQFETEQLRQQAEAALEDIRANRTPTRLVISSPDLEQFRGCWFVNWFEVVESMRQSSVA